MNTNLAQVTSAQGMKGQGAKKGSGRGQGSKNEGHGQVANSSPAKSGAGSKWVPKMLALEEKSFDDDDDDDDDDDHY